MIDSGAYANFISKDCVEKQGFETRQKEDPYPVRVYNGSINKDGRVEQETRPLVIRLYQHFEELVLDVVSMKGHEIILGVL